MSVCSTWSVGVATARVALLTKRAEVSLDKSVSTAAQLEAAVTQSGFPSRVVEQRSGHCKALHILVSILVSQRVAAGIVYGIGQPSGNLIFWLMMSSEESCFLELLQFCFAFLVQFTPFTSIPIKFCCMSLGRQAVS